MFLNYKERFRETQPLLLGKNLEIVTAMALTRSSCIYMVVLGQVS
jgi:hypothetical protein